MDGPSITSPQLVATLGPASFGLPAQLTAAGATALRLNASHMRPEALDELLSDVRARLPDLGIVVDLQGAKMRLGAFDEREVEVGERLHFALEPDGPEALPLPHAELFHSIAVSETLSCDDDRLRLCVREVGEERLVAENLRAGRLRSRKGINVLEHPVLLGDLGPLDVEHVERASRHAGVRFAISFMLDGSEARWVRRRAPGCPVIGKIERRGATLQLESIAEAVDELWICRGDLGAQLGARELAAWVCAFRPGPLRVPVLMAGQVLQHLTEHPEPTRSEVCHLHDLAQRGYAGIVLSDETAIGRDPVAAVRQAASLWPGVQG